MNNSIKQLDGLTEKEKKAVNEFVAGLRDLYGDNLNRVFLYGSKARGDSEEESDIDILVVLKNMSSTYEEIKKMSDMRAKICLKYDVVISVIPKETEHFEAPYKTILILRHFEWVTLKKCSRTGGRKLVNMLIGTNKFSISLSVAADGELSRVQEHNLSQIYLFLKSCFQTIYPHNVSKNHYFHTQCFR